jgi:hypothetical protein
VRDQIEALAGQRRDRIDEHARALGDRFRGRQANRVCRATERAQVTGDAPEVVKPGDLVEPEQAVDQHDREWLATSGQAWAGDRLDALRRFDRRRFLDGRSPKY